MKFLFRAFVISILSINAYATVNKIKINGYDVEFQLAGEGKHTILLESGGSAGLEDWELVYNELTKNAKVIRYSRIGNAGSQELKKNYSASEYAQEASLLLEALKVDKRVVLVAHSYGASIARIFAKKHPNKISALMLIEPASEHDVDIMRSIDLNKAEQQIAQIKAADMKGGMSNQYLDFWAKYPLPDYPEIPNIPVKVIASTKKHDNQNILFFTDEARKMWGELHTDWVNAFPQGKVVLTENSYHNLHQDEPEMVIKEIIKLLNRTQ